MTCAYGSENAAGRGGKTLLFSLFMLACADQVSLRLGDATIRLYYLVALAALPFYWFRIRIDFWLLLSSFLLALCLLPSIALSIDFIRSSAYFCWILVSVVASLFLLPAIAKESFAFDVNPSESLYDGLLFAFRAQLVVAVTLYIAGVDERPRFLYYEPSYFSIALAIYVNLVIRRWLRGRRGIFDLCLVLIYVITSFSGAFLIVLVVAASLNVSHLRLRTVLITGALALLVATTYVLAVDDLNTLLIRGVLSGDFDPYELLLRGGNRLSRFLVACDVFLNDPYAGVGLGSFEQATSGGNIDVYNYDTPWQTAEGLPAINIYVEILATTGVIGAVGFALLFAGQVRWLFGQGFPSPISKAVICMLVLLIFESNYLRPYLWFALGLCRFERLEASRLKRGEARHAR